MSYSVHPASSCLPITSLSHCLHLEPRCCLASLPESEKSYSCSGLLKPLGLSWFLSVQFSPSVDCVDHNKLWKIRKETRTPDHLTCLLRNLYAGQEATVRTGHGTTDWFQIMKSLCQGCILSPCLFNLFAEYIMWNVGLDEAQAEIKISRRNINNLRYTDDTTRR